MARGRKPKPTAVKILAGNPGRRPLNENEPTPPLGPMSPPRDMKGDALKCWRRLTPVLIEMKVLTLADQDALELYCTAYVHWKEAEKEIAKAMVGKTKSGYTQQSPYVSIAKQFRTEMRQLMAEFGMTPSSRSRINIKTGSEDGGDEDEDFFNKPINGKKKTQSKNLYN